MIRLEPMTPAQFRASYENGVLRVAEDRVRLGEWTEESAVETARSEMAQLLPAGQRTPNRHFCTVVDESTGVGVGETWYLIERKGGKTRLWVDWIWIDPNRRRRGFATQLLERLEREARDVGADRMGLHVLSDNRAAIALYSRLGFAPFSQRMSRRVTPLVPMF